MNKWAAEIIRHGLFSEEEVTALLNRVVEREARGRSTAYVTCLVRDREVQLKSEEGVRQLWLARILGKYGYSAKRVAVEYPVTFGRDTSKRADIVIFDADRPTVPYIIVEVKQGNLRDGKEQLRSYCHATGAPLALWSNGILDEVWHRKNPNYFVPIHHLPSVTQTIEDIVNEPWTIATLIEKEEERGREGSKARSLRDLIVELENEVLANAGVDVFEEVFKLVFTKLYDEMACHRGSYPYLRFRNSNTAAQLKEAIQSLFNEAKAKWSGVFLEDERIRLSADHLQVCVGSLEEWKLFNSNLDVIDDAFEYLVNKSSKGEKGQYFTPRWVIDMCVKMLNPQESETVIDTACGSAGFTVHAMFHVWRQIIKEMGLPDSHLFTMDKKPARCEDYVRSKVFATDFDEKSVRVARCLNLIAGDGETNVLHLNTLDWTKWNETVKQDEWQDTYSEGWTRFRKLRASKKDADYRHFNFDVLMANPPFAGDIKQSDMLASYDLAHNAKTNKMEKAVGRDLLFIERNLDFIRPGGRMAIVLPQGRFNNSSDQRVREFIMERCRILAVVGLHPNTFKPHTNTKTSVLFVQKWNDDPAKGPLCPRKSDYRIFFATQQVESVNNSGDKIYVRNEDGSFKRDAHGHFIVAHDLFNHDGLTRDGIAEAFIEFAQKERLAFAETTGLVKPAASEPPLSQGGNSPRNNDVGVLSLSSLSLADLYREQPLTFVARLSDVEAAERMDAQYFRPLFSEIERRMKAVGNAVLLGDILTKNARGKQPNYAEAGLPVINSKHVRTNRVILEDNRTAIELGSPVVIQHGDVLLNGTGVGTIGRVAPYLHERKALPDNHVTVLRTDRVDPIFLAVFLNSELGQWQIERHIKGSSGQIELYPADIARIVIWDAPKDVQMNVRDTVLSAFQQEQRALNLLDAAKHAVEIAVESGEGTAMAYLDQQEGAE